jgi:GNAT superfamily N-acetyltransferase
MNVHVRQAQTDDIEAVCAVLHEAAAWLTERGQPLWKADELTRAQITADIEGGSFYIAECEGEVAGVLKFQLEDRAFWPDIPEGESAFIHRFAVRRRFAGGTVSNAMLAWAAQRTRELGRRYLRLDCEAERPKLRAFYERFGFQHHSDRVIEPYFVSRYEYDVTRVNG